MQQSDRANFGAMVTDALAYYKQDASNFALNVWWEGCKPFSYEQISKALTAHATDPDKGQFAPKVADIVRQLAGTKTDRSLVAWGMVHSAMSDVGAYQDVDFNDAAIHSAINDMGGWPKMCRTELSELGYLQHRFCESYRAYLAAGVTEKTPLIGDRGANELYLKRGLPLPQPARIGYRPTGDKLTSFPRVNTNGQSPTKAENQH